MSSTALILTTLGAFLIIFLAVWLEYRRSSCLLGGSVGGRDNWLLRILKKNAKELVKKYQDRKPPDVCDY